MCEACDQGWREGAGRRSALDDSELARARCDAQHIGSLETDAPARAVQDVPPRVRRHVLRRDRRRCTIDGCRSAAHIEVHHIVAREHGGTHRASNLTVVCGACHDNLHRGLITLTGTAPDALVVTRRHRRDAHVCAGSWVCGLSKPAAEPSSRDAAETRAADRGTPNEHAGPPDGERITTPADLDRRASKVGAIASNGQARVVAPLACSAPGPGVDEPTMLASSSVSATDHAVDDRHAAARVADVLDRVTQSSPPSRVTVDIDAKLALVTAGFGRGEAAAAVAQARAHLGAELDLEILLREALRRVRRPPR